MRKLFNHHRVKIFVICGVLLSVFFYYASKIYSEMHEDISLSQTEAYRFFTWFIDQNTG